MRPVRKADNLPPSSAVVKTSVSLNFLEPSGPLQDCNGNDLLKIVSKLLCYVFIVTFVTFGFWMQHFQTGGLEEMILQPDHHDHRISPPINFFLWRYVKDKVFRTPVPNITNLKARITDAFATVPEDMLENTWRETDYRLDVLRAKKGTHVEVY